MMVWLLKGERVKPEHLGFIPTFFDESDSRKAADQVNERYIGGWRPLQGAFKLQPDGTLTYPGDPPLRPIAECQFRDELLLFYPHDWLAIVQADGSYEVSRLD